MKTGVRSAGSAAGRGRWRFTLEPTSLIDCFLDHPPDGFDTILSPLGTPMFAARLDVLTTVDDPVKQRLMRWPLYAWWRRALRWPAAFVGSTVSEYAPLPPVSADQWIADVLRTASAPPLAGHWLLVVKDLPHESPLLDAADNAVARALCTGLTDAGFVLLQGQALAWVPIDFTTIDEYLSRLSAGRRRELRRKLRSRSALSIDVWTSGDARLRDATLCAELYRMYENVYAQSLTQFDRLSPAFFEAVLGDATNAGRLFLYRDAGKLIGWNLCFVEGDALIDKYIGLNYPEARARNLYFVSWIVNLEYAVSHGLRRYVAGWTDPQVKAALGAQFTFTRHAVRPRSAVVRWALRRLAARFEGDRAWHETQAVPAASRAVPPARPLVLDFDGSVGELAGEVRMALPAWQEPVRFGCRLRVLRRLARQLRSTLETPHGTVFLGSGDFHHLTLALLSQLRPAEPFDVIVFDNHPDNMRYPFGVHCGSWVSHAAALPGVRHVQVIGITSADVALRNAWQNRLGPLYSGRLSYRCVGTDTAWARRLGLGDAVLSFDTVASLLDRFHLERARRTAAVYLSIDKDVLSSEVARTNWDQGILTENDLEIALRALRGGLIGSDITGEVSMYRYASPFKRWLSALDNQPAVDAARLADWQRVQNALNRRLLDRIAEIS